jgi:hypothetical protein
MKTILAVDGSDNSYQAVHALEYIARAEQLPASCTGRSKAGVP